MLEFYVCSLAGIAFLLGLTVISSLSNLHFLVLAFFYGRDVFGIGITMLLRETGHNLIHGKQF